MAPQRPIGFWLKLVDQLINDQFEAMLDEHGVTRRQWQLMSLLTNGPVHHTDLETALLPFADGTDPEPLSEQLDELVDSEWVSRVGDAFALTDRGRTSFSRLSEVVGRTRYTIGQGISEGEYEATLDVLERMARNLGWSDPVLS